MGIPSGDLRPKRAITERMVIEVAGEEQVTKAKALTASIRGMKITVPQKMGVWRS